MRTSRPLRRLKFEFGYDNAVHSAEGLVKFLNSRRGTKGFDRVERVIRAANEVDRAVRKAGYPKLAFGGIYEGRFGEEVKRAKEEIDDFLDEILPIVGLGEPRERGWSLSQGPSPTHSNLDQLEIDLAGIMVLQAATSGELRLIAQCDNCGTWFLGARAGQTFCSVECRKKAFRSTDLGRVKQAEYMRGYRARLKRRDSEMLRNARAKR